MGIEQIRMNQTTALPPVPQFNWSQMESTPDKTAPNLPMPHFPGSVHFEYHNHPSWEVTLPRDEEQPRCSDHEEHEQTKNRGKEAKSVEFSLSEIVTSYENDVLAPSLRGNR